MKEHKEFVFRFPEISSVSTGFFVIRDPSKEETEPNSVTSPASISKLRKADWLKNHEGFL